MQRLGTRRIHASGGTVTPLVHSWAMSFVNVGTLGAVPGKRDLLVEILTSTLR